MDFKISNEGELMLEESNLLTVKDIEFKVQLAMCEIASVSHDWFYDNLGTDLEEMIGKPLTDTMISVISDMILTKLYKTKLFNDGDIRIESKKVDLVSVGYNVYIKNPNIKYDYYVIEVEIDTLKGVNVKVGDGTVCLY